MSPFTIDARDKTGPRFAELVRELISGTVAAGPVEINLPNDMAVIFSRESDHIELTWDEAPEVDLFGPIDPDIIRIRAYENEAFIDLRLTNVRIKY